MRASTAMRIQGSMERNGISYGDVIARVAADENLPACDAADLVSRLESGAGCPLVVAAAVIAILNDQRLRDKGHMR